MASQIEALKLALEALDEYVEQHGQTHLAKRALPELREALAQPEQELVGECIKAEFGNYPFISWRADYIAQIGDKFYIDSPLRITPPTVLE